MDNSKLERYITMLSDLKLGKIKPSYVVGRGYRHPKAVALGWILAQIYAITHSHRMCIFTTCAGAGFTSVRAAMNSTIWHELRAQGKELSCLCIENHLVIAYKD
jgi:hypothetical protein